MGPRGQGYMYLSTEVDSQSIGHESEHLIKIVQAQHGAWNTLGHLALLPPPL